MLCRNVTVRGNGRVFISEVKNCEYLLIIGVIYDIFEFKLPEFTVVVFWLLFMWNYAKTNRSKTILQRSQ